MAELRRILTLNEDHYYDSLNKLTNELDLSSDLGQFEAIGFVQLENNDLWCVSLLNEFGEFGVKYQLIHDDKFPDNYLADNAIIESKSYRSIPDWLRFATSKICEEPYSEYHGKECFPFSSRDATIERLLVFNQIWTNKFQEQVEHNYLNEYFDSEDDYWD